MSCALWKCVKTGDGASTRRGKHLLWWLDSVEKKLRNG
jgi:hypothetical protein